MTRGMLQNSLLAFSIFGVSLYATEAHSCSCVQRTLDEHFQSNPLVFVATVIRVKKTGAHREYVFRVHKVWKGKVNSQIVLRNEASPGSCAMTFHVGQQSIVFGHGGGSDFQTSLCSGTDPPLAETIRWLEKHAKSR